MKKIIYTLFITAFIFASCSKKNDQKPSYKIDSETISLHYDGTHQFEITPNTEANSTTWSSSDTTVGKVNQSGYFTAKKIGTVTVTGTSDGYTLTSKVTVVPYSTMCKEPFYSLNQTEASTKSKEFRTLTFQSTEGLTYTGENSKLRSVLYAFDNDSMTAAALLLSNSTDVVTEAYQFFNERYTPMTEENNVYFFTDNKHLVVGVSVDDSLGFNAIYVDYSLLSANAIKEKHFDELNKMRVNTLQALKVQFTKNRPKIN